VTAYAFGDRLDALGRVGRQTTGLQLLLLFGSRARSDSHRESDWDLGYLAAPQVDPAALHGRMVEVLGTNAIDLIDLARAGGLLRFRAARDGQLLFEARPGLADEFRFEAARFWCDAAPVLQRGYEDVLAELKP
jgi:predicted nucleotidyltransferase